jgi:DNA helicase-2/ATP-dependent DNA helicase PcrA
VQHVTKIYGPPGTGKTTELIRLLDQELKRGVPLRQIAYLSHTKAAAEVIRDRFVADKSRRLVAKDAAYFRTIHSACVRQLGIGMDNIVDQGRHYREFTQETGLELVPEYDLNDYTDASEFALNYNIVLRAHHLSLAKRVGLEEVCQSLPQHAFLTTEKRELFLQSWERFKRQRSLWDFSDMLFSYLQNDQTEPLPCRVVFLDEAQDLSSLQWSVFNKMVANAERISLVDRNMAFSNMVFNGSREQRDLAKSFLQTRIVFLGASVRWPMESLARLSIACPSQSNGAMSLDAWSA